MPDMTIYPAHTYTRDWQMRERGSQIYRQYRSVAERVGEEKAFDTFSKASDFVAANYTSGVIVMGVSANTGTGVVSTESKGVDFQVPGAAAAWSNFIDHHGPLPAGAPLPGSASTTPPTQSLTVAKSMPADAAASMLVTSLRLALGTRGPAVANIEKQLAEFERLTATIAGTWTVVPSNGTGLILHKIGKEGTAKVVVEPSQGMWLRVESGDVGVALGMQPPRAGWLSVSAAPLELEKGAPVVRYIPTTKLDWQSVERPTEFVL